MSETATCVCNASSVWKWVGHWYVRRRDCWTHVKGEKDSIEVQPPGSNCVSITFRVENTRHMVSFFQLGEGLAHLLHSPAIEDVVNELGTVSISAGSTYASNSPIAASTDELNRPGFLLSNPRRRTSQTLTHTSPSSTQSFLLAIESCTHQPTMDI